MYEMIERREEKGEVDGMNGEREREKEGERIEKWEKGFAYWEAATLLTPLCFLCLLSQPSHNQHACVISQELLKILKRPHLPQVFEFTSVSNIWASAACDSCGCHFLPWARISTRYLLHRISFNSVVIGTDHPLACLPTRGCIEMK